MSRVIGAIAGLMLLANVAAADVVVGNSVISQNTISLGVYELAVSSNGTIVVEDSTSTNAEPPIAYATEEWVAANGFVTNVVVGGTNYLTDAGSITLPEIAGPQGIQGEVGPQGPAGTNGVDGLGWTGGSYESTNGIVTFTSDDGLGFSTGDLRGAQGIQGPAGPTLTSPTLTVLSWVGRCQLVLSGNFAGTANLTAETLANGVTVDDVTGTLSGSSKPGFGGGAFSQ